MKQFYGGMAIALMLICGTTTAKADISRKCPASLPDLATTLTQDLPDYLNRTYTKLGIKRQAIAASFPDTNPLPINSLPTITEAPNQIFVSILTKPIGQSKTQTLPYWLFVAKTTKGWRLAMVFTRVNNSPSIDVSDGAIAQATTTWLRDRCS